MESEKMAKVRMHRRPVAGRCTSEGMPSTTLEGEASCVDVDEVQW